jgi:hypothetical protein
LFQKLPILSKNDKNVLSKAAQAAKATSFFKWILFCVDKGSIKCVKLPF